MCESLCESFGGGFVGRMLRKLVGHCAEFVQPKDGVLLAEYFRNNKSMGIKNIQCFPQCVSEDKLDGESNILIILTYIYINTQAFFNENLTITHLHRHSQSGP